VWFGSRGRFAPDHLDQLTRQSPVELVDAALIETGKVQKRWLGPAGPGWVYLLLAGGAMT
jgi:hypothetical protein